MTNDNRIAKALEGILGQLTFVVAELRKINKPASSGQTIPPIEEFDLERNKIAHTPSELDERLLSMPPNAARTLLGMKKQNEPTIPPLEAAKAALNNRPGVMALLQSWGLKGPLKVEIINIHASGGDVKFAGLIDDMPGKQIEGIIKDVY